MHSRRRQQQSSSSRRRRPSADDDYSHEIFRRGYEPLAVLNSAQVRNVHKKQSRSSTNSSGSGSASSNTDEGNNQSSRRRSKSRRSRLENDVSYTSRSLSASSLTNSENLFGEASVKRPDDPPIPRGPSSSSRSASHSNSSSSQQQSQHEQEYEQEKKSRRRHRQQEPELDQAQPKGRRGGKKRQPEIAVLQPDQSSLELTDPVPELPSLPRTDLHSLSKSSNQEDGGQAKIADELYEELFVGVMKESKVHRVLRPNEFRLYYKAPKRRSDIPISLPLMLGYMSSRGKLFNFPVLCSPNASGSEKSWQVDYNDPRPVTFPTLSALVKYHKIYSYMDPQSGVIDTFPVWRDNVDLYRSSNSDRSSG